MGISYMSVISFAFCMLSVFSGLFTVGSADTVYQVATLLFCISSILGLFLPIFAKRHRKMHDLCGRGLEISSMIISFCTFSLMIGNDTVGLIISIIAYFTYAKTSNNVTPASSDSFVDNQKHWILRPVAWFLTILMMLALQLIAELLCRGGEYIVSWLSGLSTILIVLLTLAFGSIFLGIITYSVTLLPALVVTVSDKVYPSNHAFRYYFVGIYEIIGCAILIYAAMIGAVTGGSMFWFYARYIWLIIVSIIMVLIGHSTAKERHLNNNQPIPPSEPVVEKNHEKKLELREYIENLKKQLKEADESYEANRKILEKSYTDEELDKMVANGDFTADQAAAYKDKRRGLEMLVAVMPTARKDLVKFIGDATKELAELELE